MGLVANISATVFDREICTQFILPIMFKKTQKSDSSTGSNAERSVAGLNLSASLYRNQASDEDFAFIREIVYKLSRISLGPQKRTMVLSRVARRMRALSLSTVKEYCELIKKPVGASELSSLIDVVSTNHTYFFRESKHFDYMMKTMLGSANRRRSKPFKVWSAACSSGEEPYSLGMMLMEQCRIELGFDWSMEATDISSIVLDKAKSAIYPDSVLARVPEALTQRYCKLDASGTSFAIKPEIVKRVRFHQLNLFEIPSHFPADFDLIVCRNVMIYFDRPTREQLIRSLTYRLKPGGTLFVGHSESLSGLDHSLKMVKPAIYIKG